MMAWPEFTCPGNLLSYKETFPTPSLRKATSNIFPPTSHSRHSTPKLLTVSQSRAESCISLTFYPFPCGFFYAGLKQSREQAAAPSLPVSMAAEGWLRAQVPSLSGEEGSCSALQTDRVPGHLRSPHRHLEMPGIQMSLLFSLFLTFIPVC